MSRKNWEIYFEAVKKMDWPKARKVLNEISRDEKMNPQVYLKMGDVCQRDGDTASAIKSYHISARIQCLQGFNQKAIALYKIILRLDPRNPEALAKTEQLVNELESSRGQHFQPPPMPEPGPELVPEMPVEIKAVPVETPLPPPSLAPAAAAPPEGADWLEGTSLASAEKPPEKTEGPPPDAGGLSAGPEWLQTTTHEAPVEKTREAAPPADIVIEIPAAPFGGINIPEPEVAEAPSGGIYVPEPDIPAEPGMPSLDEIFSELPEDDFQKLLDDLVIPLSERQAAESTVPELFSGMSEEEYNVILTELEKKKYLNNAAVVEEGDSGDSMYIIKSGQARVVAHMLGREVELARLGEGALFGEVAFLSGRPRTASVLADGTLEVYEISRFDIEKLIERNPEILSRLEGFYESRVRDTIQKIMPKQT